MEKLVFSSSNEALMYLANTLNRKVIIAAKSEVKNPRSKPKNELEEKNWNRSEMWGDPKNHKYPLFDTSGELDVKKCKSALRYLNMPRSKKSYPNNKARAKVLTKVIKTIFNVTSSLLFGSTKLLANRFGCIKHGRPGFSLYIFKVFFSKSFKQGFNFLCILFIEVNSLV